MKDLLQLAVVLTELQDDLAFLQAGYTSSVSIYNKLLAAGNTGAEKLKGASWDCVEYSELQQEAQAFADQLESQPAWYT